MDHQVQHDAHIGGSEGVTPGAHRFDVLRTRQMLDDRVPGGIEAFDVAHLQHETTAAGQCDEAVGFRDGFRDRASRPSTCTPSLSNCSATS